MALQQTPEVDHPIYKRAETPETADGLAWVFKNEKELVPYYFTFPPLGAKEVRIKVHHTGLCHSDVMTARQYWGPAFYPLCPGHEAIGEVTLVGAEVTTHKVGDIVGFGPSRSSCWACHHCETGLDNICPKMELPEKLLYGKYFGGYATHMQHPATHAVKVPAGLDLTISPPLLCAGVTVFAPVARDIKDKNAFVGVIGIGGLGHLAVQFVKKLGNKVAAFTTSADKVEFIKKLGADEVIVVDKELTELKKNAGRFDYLVNTLPVSNQPLLEGYLGTLVNGGSLIQVGAPDANTNFSISFFTIIARQLKISGSAIGSVAETAETLSFAQEHQVNVIAEKFSFEDLPKAFERLEHGRPHFRCVVNVIDYTNKHFNK